MTYLFVRLFLWSILFKLALSVPAVVSNTTTTTKIDKNYNTTQKEETNTTIKEAVKNNVTETEEISNGTDVIVKQTIEQNSGSILSREEKDEILRLHNDYRSKAMPAAANMRLMTWDLVAEKSAQLWAEYCSFERGMPKGYEKSPMGRNAYLGRNFTIGRAVSQWWNQSLNYNYWTKCKPGTRCGSYTQIMWASSDRVGCGIFACPKWNLFVCHYEPAGNYIGVKPYEAGVPCSQCDTDNGGRCFQNLCVKNDECETSGLKCTCPLQCRHCGVFDKENCRCDCKDGWDSLDCSKPCENSHPWCLQNPGFPSNESCIRDERIKNNYCRAMCDQCTPSPPGNPKVEYDASVPGGIKCPSKFYYDQTTCECVFTG